MPFKKSGIIGDVSRSAPFPLDFKNRWMVEAMERLIFATAFVLLVGTTFTQVWAASCDKSDTANTLCSLPVDKLRPTQFSIGSIVVNCKAASVAKKSRKKLKKYLKASKNIIPVVVGQDGNFYMTDRHHFTSTIYRAQSPSWEYKDKILQIHIVDNYYGQDMAWGGFWEVMQKQNRSYNYDNKGIPDMNYALLPDNVGGLLNDPYRTLSLWVRESCAYVKKDKKQCASIRTDHPHEAPLFMELYWGDFFRQHLPLSIAGMKVCQSIPYSSTCLSDEVEQLKSLYPKAISLAASEQAKKYFEEQNLDPWNFGYNPSGKHLQLAWRGPEKACAKPEIE